MTKRTRRLLAGLSAAVIALFGLTTAGHAAATTGAITGHVTNAIGQPAQFIAIDLYSATCNYLQSVNADEGGAFTFPNLAPGGYKLQFWFLGNGGLQWYHQKLSCAAATTVSVVAGGTATISESPLPAGTITGHLVDSHGQPVTDAFIHAETKDLSQVLIGFTDDSGDFEITAFPGAYTVSFQMDHSTQYAYQSRTQQGATVFTVVAGERVVVDDQLLPTGSISGRFTDAAGHPVEGELVSASDDGSSGGFTFTDSDGRYTIPALFAGPGFVVSFGSPDGLRLQYAVGKLTQGSADRFTVTADADTTVNDSELPTGSIAITAKDGATGASIANFCVIVADTACSNGTGQVLLTGLLEGPHLVQVYTEDDRYVPVDTFVTVVGGQTTNYTASLQPGGTITAVVKDRRTGQPVPACVLPQPVGDPVLPDVTGYCDDSGTVHMGHLDAGSYNLFVHPDDNSAYGVQWVGASGGTGDPRSAVVITIGTGGTATAPTILLDPPGSITGSVADAATGAPLPSALVSMTSVISAVGPTRPFAETDSAGRYTLSGLGPYNWPLWIEAAGHADQWSGGVGNRVNATPVKVNAGATVTFNSQLATGSTLAGSIRDAAGHPVGNGYVRAYNAATGDIMGEVWAEADGKFQIPVLGQQIKVQYLLVRENGHNIIGWYGGADRAHATTIVIPAPREVPVPGSTTWPPQTVTRPGHVTIVIVTG